MRWRCDDFYCIESGSTGALNKCHMRLHTTWDGQQMLLKSGIMPKNNAKIMPLYKWLGVTAIFRAKNGIKIGILMPKNLLPIPKQVEFLTFGGRHRRAVTIGGHIGEIGSISRFRVAGRNTVYLVQFVVMHAVVWLICTFIQLYGAIQLYNSHQPECYTIVWCHTIV